MRVDERFVYFSILNILASQLFVSAQDGISYRNYSYFHTYNFAFTGPITNSNGQQQDPNVIIQRIFPMQDAPTPYPIPYQNNQPNPTNVPTNQNFSPHDGFPPAGAGQIPAPESARRQNQINQPRKSRENSPLVFPAPDYTNLPSKRITVNGTNCSYGFCEDATDYPEEIIRKLLEGANHLEAFFRPKPPDISERFNVDFENLCTVNKSKVIPKTAKNIQGKEKIIVNIDGYKQVVDSEICREDATCMFQEYWPIGYSGKCIQKYVEVPLATMDDNNLKIVIDTFSYPSGCFCASKSL